MGDVYCNNCETEAVKRYRGVGGDWFNMCYTCSEAFLLGQCQGEEFKGLVGMDEEQESEGSDG